MAQLRPYRESDWDAFLALDIETGLISLRYAPEEDREAFQKRWPDVLRERYQWSATGPTTDKAALWVLEDDDGSYAGHLWLREQEDPLTGVLQLWVVTMAIVARYRSRGYGRLLAERAMEEARTRGIRSIGLEVDADNVVARKLYEEIGFQTVKLRMTSVLRNNAYPSRRPSRP